MDKYVGVLKWILQLEFLDGLTAKLGGAGLVFGGIGSLVGRLTGTYDPFLASQDLEMLAIGNGLGILGIRKRQDRKT